MLGINVRFVFGGQVGVNRFDEIVAHHAGQAIGRQAQEINALPALQCRIQFGEAFIIWRVAGDLNFDVGVVQHELCNRIVKRIGELVAGRVT